MRGYSFRINASGVTIISPTAADRASSHWTAIKPRDCFSEERYSAQKKQFRSVSMQDTL
jgi:hypothetical protein